jgi:hypothetical protein
MKIAETSEKAGRSQGLGEHNPVMELNEPAEQVMSNDPICVYPDWHPSVHVSLLAVTDKHVPEENPVAIVGSEQEFSSQRAMGEIRKVWLLHKMDKSLDGAGE